MKPIKVKKNTKSVIQPAVLVEELERALGWEPALAWLDSSWRPHCSSWSNRCCRDRLIHQLGSLHNCSYHLIKFLLFMNCPEIRQTN